MNYDERLRSSHWNRQLWVANDGDWEKSLSKIDNPYLKVKVANIILWDSTSEDLKEDRDFSYLKSLSDTYRPFFEDGFKQDELEQSLIRVGYPRAHAIKRATPPKGWNHEYYRRLKIKQEAQ